MSEMLINGVERSTISAVDRGLMYGDGLFETIKLVKGEPQNWSLHLQRLSRGAERLGITMPDGELLLSELRALSKARVRPQTMPLVGARPQLQVRGQPQALAKIVLTRGVGGRGYYPQKLQPTRIIQLFPWPELPVENACGGVRVRICQLQLAHQPALAGLKHLNRLENVIARGEWEDAEIAEGLMQDQQGNFIEGTMSNLFVVKDHVLYTDPLQQCGVAGVMREHIIELAQQQGIGVQLQQINQASIETADELFLCNAVIGIWPIREIVNLKHYAVGEVTRQLQVLIKGA